jgi:thymidylate synthase
MNQIPTVVEGETILLAWRAAAQLLVSDGPRFNLVVHIPPERLWIPNNRSDFYAHYSKVYARGHKRKTSAWGTYFQRLIEFGDTKINQTERVITALSGWGRIPHAALVLHLSASSLDKPKPLGAPCWQYGQLNVEDGRASLTVVYRSHDYFQKCLGNFVGLARLLKFVCAESGMTPGSLTCFSTFAHLGNSRAATRTLLANV